MIPNDYFASIVYRQLMLQAKLNQQIHTIPKLKQGIDDVYVTVDFIYMGLVEL